MENIDEACFLWAISCYAAIVGGMESKSFAILRRIFSNSKTLLQPDRITPRSNQAVLDFALSVAGVQRKVVIGFRHARAEEGTYNIVRDDYGAWQHFWLQAPSGEEVANTSFVDGSKRLVRTYYPLSPR